MSSVSCRGAEAQREAEYNFNERHSCHLCALAPLRENLLMVQFRLRIVLLLNLCAIGLGSIATAQQKAKKAKARPAASEGKALRDAKETVTGNAPQTRAPHSLPGWRNW